jgi:hypothetical protein
LVNQEDLVLNHHLHKLAQFQNTMLLMPKTKTYFSMLLYPSKESPVPPELVIRIQIQDTLMIMLTGSRTLTQPQKSQKLLSSLTKNSLLLLKLHTELTVNYNKLFVMKVVKLKEEILEAQLWNLLQENTLPKSLVNQEM